MSGAVLHNGAMLGASIAPIVILAAWGAVMWIHRVTDPVPWGLLIFTYIFVSIMAAVGAEISWAIRSRQS